MVCRIGFRHPLYTVTWVASVLVITPDGGGWLCVPRALYHLAV